MQEGVPVNVPSSTPSSSAPTNVQRIMPLLYVGQSNMKPMTPATPSSNPGVVSTSGPTILTAVPQIQIAGSGNPQIIHSSPNPNTYSYVPVRQVYAKAIKDQPKKVFVTSINSGPNNKSNQVNLILPNVSNNQNTNSGNKSPITSLILPQIGPMQNKVTGMIVQNNPGSGNTNKLMGSLLLPANTKYPNIAPNKKVPIPNILIPQQNVSNKQTNVPNIIRQTNNNTGKNVVGIISTSSSNQTTPQMTSLLLTPNSNPNNKQPPTSVGLILPTSGGSQSIIVSQPTGSQSHGIIMPQSTAGQTHGIIVPQSTGGGIIVPHSSGQSHGLLVPHSTGGQTQVTNLFITSSTTSNPQSTNTPVASLLISNASSNPNPAGPGHMTSLLIPQSSSNCSSPQLITTSTTTMPAGGATQKTSILVPVSVGPTKTVLQPVTYSNGKKNLENTSSMIFAAARENKQSLLVKPSNEGNYPTLPPLQPISIREGVPKSIITKPPNGLNVPESLIMTPVTDNDMLKNKLDKISDDMTIERTSSVSTEDKSTGTSITMKLGERVKKVEDQGNKVDVGITVSPIPPRNEKDDEGVVLDGEVTVRRLGPDKEEIREKKQMDDDVKIELVKPERQKHTLEQRFPFDQKLILEQKIPSEQKVPALPRYQKPEDLNPLDVLEWDNQGVGKLPGSNIKFRLNEYGLDLVVDSNKDDCSSSNTPNSSRRNSDDKPPNSEIKRTKEKDLIGEGTEKIYCCEGCGCYGLYTEFLTDTRFCSVGCKKIVLARNEMKKKRQDDKMRELRLRRKRRKIKILAQRAKRGSLEQKILKDFDENKGEPMEEAGLIKAWSNKMAELRKTKKTSDGNIKINMADESGSEDTRGDKHLLSDSDLSETNSPLQTGLSEDDASSDRTAANSDTGKETSWINSSGEFMWSTYLQKCCNKAKVAPIRFFKDPFPDGKNSFKVGMKLEGIDPEHQAIISVLTVAQVKGHRIRLHFDGYPENHDFWVNSDSPDIFPPGWCERNNHTLHPPRGYTMENFSWNTYLKQCRAQPAPKSLFPKSNTPLCPSQFRVGMKLEAVDRKNSSLICVSTVSNLIDNRLLIHFDSWGDVYDYWTDPSSPYIHPVGWCQENGHDLTPPNTYKNPSQFTWDAYLKETKSQAAPARAFKPRPPNMFKRGMKLEAIDKRAPHLLRPATIKEVKEYQIKITFDGYPAEFGYWVDDDCPDIHPSGWGHKTGHPVAPPPMVPVKNECGTKGCSGDGNIKGGFMTKHTTAALCPYSPQNLNRDNVPDRFCMNPDFYEVPEPISNRPKTNSIKPESADDTSCSESRIKTRYSSSTTVKEDFKEEPIKVESEEKTEERVERRGRKRKLPEAESRVEQMDRLRRDCIQSIYTPGYNPKSIENETWAKHVATLGLKVSVTGGDPRSWNHKQVAAFVNTVIPSRAKIFLDQEIDGEAFLMLIQDDLMSILGLKLGPAIKIYNCIVLLRQKVLAS